MPVLLPARFVRHPYRLAAAAAMQLPALLAAYRGSGGVAWAQYGPDARESQADMNRPWFEQALAPALRDVPDLDTVLRAPGARIGDIRPGAGWSSIALARAHPEARIDGYDIDAASVDLARSNAAEAGVGDRLGSHGEDAARLPEGTYDVIFAFECVHEIPRPVEVLGPPGPPSYPADRSWSWTRRSPTPSQRPATRPSD